MSRYRIEYLTETTEEDSVCLVITSPAETLDEAGQAAFECFCNAQRTCGASGFQIRDMRTEEGTIVALETLDRG